MDEIKNAKENMVELQADLSGRCLVCKAESEDFKDYAELRIKSAQVMNESQKIENQHIIELEKLKLERERLKKDTSWVDPKILIPVVFPIAWSASELLYKTWFLTNIFQDVEKWEKDNTITGTPGKWFIRAVNSFIKI